MTSVTRRDGLAAWEAVLADRSARWPKDGRRFADIVYPARYTPSVRIAATDRMFCIGSCFARNVEEHLIRRGMTVLSRRLVNPVEEWGGRPNGIVNKFTTESILNEIRWLSRPPALSARHFVETPIGWFDMQLSPGTRPVTLERAIERRAYLTAGYFARLAEADVVVLTLGLNEVWSDTSTGLCLNAVPPILAARREPDRYRVEATDVARNVAALEEIRDRLRTLRPGLRFVVTVSPVPLDLTFLGGDPVVANMRSKSVLRAAAEAFVSAHDDVDYVPSYEMIAMAPRALAFAENGRHVNDRAVAAVIAAFLAAHGIDGPVEGGAEGEAFNELGYLAANPDVEQAVRAGVLESGFHHWTATGRAEGRALMPPGGATPLMREIGAA